MGCTNQYSGALDLNFKSGCGVFSVMTVGKLPGSIPASVVQSLSDIFLSRIKLHQNIALLYFIKLHATRFVFFFGGGGLVYFSVILDSGIVFFGGSLQFRKYGFHLPLMPGTDRPLSSWYYGI